MLEKKIKQSRELLLNEIVSTLEYLDYLKFEAKTSTKRLILKFELKKLALVAELRALELIAY